MRLGAAVLVASAVALGGCGSGDEDDPAAAQPGGTNLRIALDVDGDGTEPASEKQVICEEGMETSPCPELLELTADDLAAVPADTACTEIFGGPEVVTVTGSVHGRAVDVELTRANGCEIERFGRFVSVLRELYPGYEPGEALQPPG